MNERLTQLEEIRVEFCPSEIKDLEVAAGQPTLFTLLERRFKTVELAAEDYERRERWRQYQVHCGRLINRFGVAGARKVVK